MFHGILTRDCFLFSTEESAATEPPKSASVSKGGIIALGVVFGIFAVAMGTFVGYLIYRERKGKPSFAPQVSFVVRSRERKYPN